MGSVSPPEDALQARLAGALGSEFTVLRLLGRGAMGAVYLARDEALDRLVAVKVLPPEMSATSEMRERFKREAKTVAALNHPGIVPLHRLGEGDDGLLYFVMGFVQGESLADRMRRAGPLPEAEVRRILAELAEALQYAHQRGVVHRDLKPENVLIDDQTGRVMLSDFGIARSLGSATLTEQGAVVGTPYYMAPEQASGEREIDGRADLFALGVLGYTALAGSRPFEGESMREILANVVATDPRPLGELVPGVDPDFASSIMRCLAKDPGGRWPNAGELRSALPLARRAAYRLPDELDALDGMLVRTAGQTAMIGGLLIGMASLMPLITDTPFFGTAELLAMIPAFLGAMGILPIYQAIVAWRGLRRGRELGVPDEELKRAILRPPKWWSYWWPSAWRSGDDRFDSLVPEVRRARNLESAGAGLTIALTIPMLVMIALDARGFGGIAQYWWVALIGIVVALVLTLAGNFSVVPLVKALAPEHRTARLASRLLDTPTTDPEWRRLPLSLFMQSDEEVTSLPRTPEELAEGIVKCVAEITGPAAELAREASEVAGEALKAIEDVEREIARLEADLDPDELARLEARVADEPEGEFQREMHALARDQLRLLRVLDERLGQCRARRARLQEELRNLWLHVARLRAESREDESEDITWRLEVLRAEISGQTRALVDTKKMLAGDGA